MYFNVYTTKSVSKINGEYMRKGKGLKIFCWVVWMHNKKYHGGFPSKIDTAVCIQQIICFPERQTDRNVTRT